MQESMLTLDNLKCDKCECELFEPGFFLKDLPSVMSDDGKPGLIPVQAWACMECGHVNDKFNPLKVNSTSSILIN